MSALTIDLEKQATVHFDYNFVCLKLMNEIDFGSRKAWRKATSSSANIFYRLITYELNLMPSPELFHKSWDQIVF